MARCVLVLFMLAVAAACSAAAQRPPATPAGDCSIPLESWADLQACEGESETIELDVADDFQGKTTSKIAVSSKDPEQILAAMGAFAREWSSGADSFTVWAFGSVDDAADGGFNRGMLFWNDGGPIEVTVCTKWFDVGDGGPEICDEPSEFTFPNR